MKGEWEAPSKRQRGGGKELWEEGLGRGHWNIKNKIIKRDKSSRILSSELKRTILVGV